MIGKQVKIKRPFTIRQEETGLYHLICLFRYLRHNEENVYRNLNLNKVHEELTMLLFDYNNISDTDSDTNYCRNRFYALLKERLQLLIFLYNNVKEER